MQRITLSLFKPNRSSILKAAEMLKSGGVIVYPTDTAYGLGANALSEEAVRKAFEVKGRDYSKPIHVVVKDLEMAQKFVEVNEIAEKLATYFLPGPLTLILPKKKIVPDLLTANLPTLGIRIPNCEVTKALSCLVDFPYTTTSANLSGNPASYSIEEVLTQLDPKKIDLVLDAGVLPKILPSTLLDLTCTPPKILREGPVSREEIEKVLETPVSVC